MVAQIVDELINDYFIFYDYLRLINLIDFWIFYRLKNSWGWLLLALDVLTK